jgi:hypothetical protein
MKTTYFRSSLNKMQSPCEVHYYPLIVGHSQVKWDNIDCFIIFIII